MAKKNAFLERQRQTEDRMFSAGIRCGIQYNNDMYHIVLNDPEIMGKDTFGAERLEKIHKAVEKMSDHYSSALDANDPEADYYREKLDSRLRKIWKDKLLPFEERLHELRKISYGGKKR